MKLLNTLDANGNRLKNIPDGVDPQDAATLAQLQAMVMGLKWKDPVRAATTANVTLSGLQTIDGVALAVGDRVLVKNQSAGAANGIYLAASGAWTRTTDFDASSEALGASVFVSEGTSQGNQQWQMTTDGPITIGTTVLVWSQFGGGTSYTAGNGILIVGAVVSVDPAVVARKAAATIGDGTATTVTIVHNLGTRDVHVSVREAATNAGVLCDWVANTDNSVQLTFAVAPTVGQFRAAVMG